LSLPMNHAKKYSMNFLSMKATILDTHGTVSVFFPSSL
jgi:hypothetical protein